MKVFVNDFIESIKISYYRKRSVFILSLIGIVTGIIIGCILSFTIDDLKKFLSLSDKNYFSILKGTASSSSFFTEMVKDVFLASFVCCVCSTLNVILPISLFYLSYQSTILILQIASLVSEFGFIGVINSLFLVLPFNLLLLVCMGLIMSFINSFTTHNIRNKLNLFSMKNDKYIFVRIIAVLLIQLSICIIMSYFIPFLLRSLIIVNY